MIDRSIKGGSLASTDRAADQNHTVRYIDKTGAADLLAPEEYDLRLEQNILKIDVKLFEIVALKLVSAE